MPITYGQDSKQQPIAIVRPDLPFYVVDPDVLEAAAAHLLFKMRTVELGIDDYTPAERLAYIILRDSGYDFNK